jgi:hypothetical protein
MDRIVESYCLDCEWTAATDIVGDRNKAVVKHTVTTDHDIDSVCINTPLESPRSPALN